MYKHIETDDTLFSIHDCYAEKMCLNDGVLTVTFPNGFWVLEKHPQNESDNIVRTDDARVDFKIIDDGFDAIEIFVFKQQDKIKAIRKYWETEKFINAVNNGAFKLEFIDCYKRYQYILFKCQLWFDKEPYHAECEIILHTDKAVYNWNSLCYDRVW
ncbi:MAG: hypothetical protein IJ297_08045 [Clostridia bacterium]|nr:hypothetical protein [Clostridia bacterium]